ncbi:MAG: 2-phospho-L-lactate transferase CofD family protein, partial [Candidatus Omnitrophota bacterium]|nr:2-phospho-L-lactate transferase CofD family protein [Candidatus Omnitrophota bacterium]
EQVRDDDGSKIKINGALIEDPTFEQYLLVKVEQLLKKLYQHVEPEIRTDKGQASETAKRSRGSLNMTRKRILALRQKYPGLKVNEDHFLAGIEFRPPRQAGAAASPAIGYLDDFTIFAIGDLLGISNHAQDIAKAYKTVVASISPDQSDRHGDFRQIFNNPQLRFQLRSNMASQARQYFDQLSLRRFSRLVLQELFKENVERNTRPGFGLSIGADLQLENPARQDQWDQAMKHIHERIDWFTGRPHLIVVQQGGSLRLTLSSIIRTITIRQDNAQAIREAYQQLLEKAAEIQEEMGQKSRKVGTKTVYSAEDMIREIVTQAQPIRMKVRRVGYDITTGTFYMEFEPFPESRGTGAALLKIQEQLINVPMDVKPDHLRNIRVTIGWAIEPLDEQQVAEIESINNDPALFEGLPDQEITNIRVSLYGDRGHKKLFKRIELIVGQENPSFRFQDFFAVIRQDPDFQSALHPYAKLPVSRRQQAKAIGQYGEGVTAKAKVVLADGQAAVEVTEGALDAAQVEALSSRLDGLAKSVRGPPVTIAIAVTTHVSDLQVGGQLYVATSDIGRSLVNLHPQFFRKGAKTQKEILYHEIYSHIVKAIRNEDAAMADTDEFMQAGSSWRASGRLSRVLAVAAGLLASEQLAYGVDFGKILYGTAVAILALGVLVMGMAIIWLPARRVILRTWYWIKWHRFWNTVKDLLGVEHLSRGQRVKDASSADQLVDNAVGRIVTDIRKAERSVDDPMSRRWFRQQFGVRTIVWAGDEAQSFSRSIPESLLRSGLPKTNLRQVLEGYYTTPGVKPVVVIGDALLGRILRDEYLSGYDPQSGIWLVDAETKTTLAQEMFVPEPYLHGRKVLELGVRSDNVVFAYGRFKGEGDAVMRVVEKLEDMGLGDGVQYTQIAYAGMPTVNDTSKPNVPYVNYLHMISGSHLAVVGARPAPKDGKNGYTLESLKGQMLFFKEKKWISSLQRWEDLPEVNDGERLAPSQAEWKTVIEDLNRWDEVPNERKNYIRVHYAISETEGMATLLVGVDFVIMSNVSLLSTRDELRAAIDSEDCTVCDIWSLLQMANEMIPVILGSWKRTIAPHQVEEVQESRPVYVQPVEYVPYEDTPQRIRTARDQIAWAETALAGQHALPRKAVRESVSQDDLNNLRAGELNAVKEKIQRVVKVESSRYRLEGGGWVAAGTVGKLRSLTGDFLSSLSRDIDQGKLLQIIFEIEGEAVQAESEPWSSMAPEYRQAMIGVLRDAVADAIDRGLVANNLEGLTANRAYIGQILELRRRYARDVIDPYLLQRMGHIYAQALRTQRREDLTMTELVFGRNVFGGVSGSQVKRKVVFVTGGTAIGTMYQESSQLAGLAEEGTMFYGIVTNNDDGGYSYEQVTRLNSAGYGIIPPQGDQMNTIQGFVGADKRTYILGDGGRIADKTTATTLFEGTLPLVIETVGDAGLELQEDFFYFGLALMTSISKVDELNKNREPVNHVMPVAKASVRNLFSLGFLHEQGFFSQPTEDKKNRSAVETPQQQEAYRKAVEQMLTILGISNFQVIYSSYEPHTLYGLYKGWTVIVKQGHNGLQRVTIEVKQRPEHDEVEVIVRNPAVNGRREVIEKVLREGQQATLKQMGIDLGLAEGSDFYIGNRGGRVLLGVPEKNRSRWLVEERANANETYLVHEAHEFEIGLANDGTGRKKEHEGVKGVEDPVFRIPNGRNGKAADIFVRTRLVKTQTHMTETINDVGFEEVGFLEGMGMEGQRPVERKYSQINTWFNELLETLNPGDVVFFGPGSFLTSLMPHFMVEEFIHKLRMVRQKGVSIVFFNNGTQDNETIHMPFYDLTKIFYDVTGYHLEHLFAYIVMERFGPLELMPDLEKRLAELELERASEMKDNPLAAAEALAEQLWKLLAAAMERDPAAVNKFPVLIQYGRQALEETGHTADSMLDMENEEAWKAAVHKLAELIDTVYRVRPQLIRTDPGAASEAAKEAVGPFVLTAEDRKKLAEIKAIEVSMLVHRNVPKREPGKFTTRPLYDTGIVAEIISQIVFGRAQPNPAMK